MNTSLIARNAARRAAVARPRASASVRKYAAQPPPPPLGPPPLAEAETKGSSLPLILGALTAAGGLGYYFYSTTDANEKDVKQKAKELDHAARLQAQSKVDEGREKFDEAKAEGRAKIDSAQSSVQSTYNSAATKASNAAAEAQARLASYKDSAASALHSGKESTERGAHDTKVYADQKAEEAKSSWWSWIGWGKSKGEDAKEKAAGEAAKGAKNVKEAAADAEKEARKRA